MKYFLSFFALLFVSAHGSTDGYVPVDDPVPGNHRVPSCHKDYDKDEGTVYSGAGWGSRFYQGNSQVVPEGVRNGVALSLSLQERFKDQLESMREKFDAKFPEKHQSHADSGSYRLEKVVEGAVLGLMAGIGETSYSFSHLSWKEEDLLNHLMPRVFGYAVAGGWAAYNALPHSTSFLADATKESLKRTFLVCKRDLRRKVTTAETVRFPWRVHGELQMEYLDETGTSIERRSFGSGTLVGKKYVLTAAHNLYSRKHKIFPDFVTFYPGRNGSTAPWCATGEKIFIHKNYHAGDSNTMLKSDIGILKLKEELELGYFGLSAKKSVDIRDVEITGYPAEKKSEMYTMGNSLGRLSDGRLFYDIDTTPGQSGSSVCMKADKEKGSPYTCIGVHTYGRSADPYSSLFSSGLNSGTHIDRGHLDTLVEWMN